MTPKLVQLAMPVTFSSLCFLCTETYLLDRSHLSSAIFTSKTAGSMAISFNSRANAETSVTNLYRFLWSQFNLYFLHSRRVKLNTVLRTNSISNLTSWSVVYFVYFSFVNFSVYENARMLSNLYVQFCRMSNVYYAMHIIRKAASLCKYENVSGPLHKALQVTGLNLKFYNFKLYVTVQNIKYRPSYKLQLLF